MPRFSSRTHRPRRPTGPWKAGPIPVIGVVGGIGSGKTAAAALFGALGAFVIDADRVGHALLDQSPSRERVVERFGPGLLTPSDDPERPPAVDRKALGAVVFADPAALRDLEAILHPRMRATFEKAIARTVRRGEAKAVVLDAAVLFEAGWNDLCDRVVFVDAPRDLRLARLAESRGWTEPVLDAREAAQKPLENKRHQADFDVVNRAGPDELRREVERAWRSVLDSAPASSPPRRDPWSAPKPGRPPAAGVRAADETEADAGPAPFPTAQRLL